jgi:hypothetical protein
MKPWNRTGGDINCERHIGAAGTADTRFAICRRPMTLDGGEGAATRRRSCSLFLHIFKDTPSNKIDRFRRRYGEFRLLLSQTFHSGFDPAGRYRRESLWC